MKKKRKRNQKRKLIFDTTGIKAFSIRLKTIRKITGYTQSQLAYEAGISLSQIARIETARINPTLSTVFTIVRVLELPLSEFFDFELPPLEE